MLVQVVAEVGIPGLQGAPVDVAQRDATAALLISAAVALDRVTEPLRVFVTGVPTGDGVRLPDTELGYVVDRGVGSSPAATKTADMAFGRPSSR